MDNVGAGRCARLIRSPLKDSRQSTGEEVFGAEPLAPRAVETGALPRATASQGASSPPELAPNSFFLACIGWNLDRKVGEFHQRVRMAGTIERAPTREIFARERRQQRYHRLPPRNEMFADQFRESAHDVVVGHFAG